MGLENVTLDLRKPAAVAPLDQSALFENMESTQKRVNPYLPTSSLSDTNYLKAIPADIQEKTIQVMDKICKEVGHKPLSRRLLELNLRIALAAEQHIFMKKEKDHKKKGEIEVNVQDQKSMKGYQATTHGVVGYGSVVCSILGNYLGGTAGQLLTQVGTLSQPARDTILTILDGKQGPLHHEQQLYLSLAQSEKQAVEGLKNLPEQLRNLILELMRGEKGTFESIGQQR